MEPVSLSFSPLRDARPAQVLAWARAAEDAGFGGIFIPESFNDSLAYAQAVAAVTRRVTVGTAITNVYLRHPTLLAQQAAAVQEFSGGRFVLGLGVGHGSVNRSLGIDMGKPTAKIREIIGVLRRAWVKGPHQPRPETPPPIFAAALAPGMVRLVGELADGVIFNLFPLARYERALRWLREGAARGGRGIENLEIYHFTTCYLGDDRAACLHEAKRMLARYANLPFYGNMLADCGFADEIDAIRTAMKAREVAKAESLVSDEMADAVTLIGDPARCRERLAAYRSAGARHCIVFPNPVGESRGAAVARAIDGLRPR